MADADQVANARLAYQEICKSFQSIIDFRVKLLGFLPLTSGAGAYAVLSKDPIPAWSWVAGVFGFLITLGLFLYELRGLQRAMALEQGGRELETQLGITSGQFREQPEAALHGLVDLRGAALLIYPTIEASWLYLVGVRQLGTLWAAIAAAVVAVAVGWWMARRHTATHDQAQAALAARAAQAPANYPA